MGARERRCPPAPPQLGGVTALEDEDFIDVPSPLYDNASDPIGWPEVTETEEDVAIATAIGKDMVDIIDDANVTTAGTGIQSSATWGVNWGAGSALYAVFREQSNHHSRGYLGQCGHAGCGGYDVVLVPPHDDRVFHHPDVMAYQVLRQSGGFFRFQDLSRHHRRCYLGVCGHSGCHAPAYAAACTPESDIRVWRYPTTVEWSVYEYLGRHRQQRVTGELQAGKKYLLHNRYHDCFLATCGYGKQCGGYNGNSCYRLPHDRFSRHPDTFVFQMYSPRPPVGYWDPVCTNIGGLCQQRLTVGVTTSSGRTLTRSDTLSMSSTLGATIGFDPAGSVTASTTVSTSLEVSQAYTMNVERAASTTTVADCNQVPALLRKTLWQWKTTIVQPGGEVRTVNTHIYRCTWGQNAPTPKCAAGFCNDQQCQTCRN